MKAACILVVDGEQNVREAWAKALRMVEGFSVSVAGDAASALDLCDETTFDVVVLDFIMPAMDGVQLLARIRKRLPLCRSILISGQLDQDVDPEEIKQRIEHAVETDIYLHKPVANTELTAAIKSLLSEDEPEWHDIAKKVTTGRRTKLTKARGAARDLKKLKRSPKKKK